MAGSSLPRSQRSTRLNEDPAAGGESQIQPEHPIQTRRRRSMWHRLRKMSALSLAISLLVVAAVGCSGGSHSVDEAPAKPAKPVAGMSGEPRHGAEGVHGGRASAGASKSEEMRPAAAANQVVIDNFTFDPPTLTVPAGTTVTWVNHDDVPHTATSTAKPKSFASGTLDTDNKFSHVFTAPGTYEYFCAVHPKMTGKIIVK
jgi:plastocyanin